MKLNSLIKSLIVTGSIALAASSCGVNSLTTAAGTSSVTPDVPSGITATQGTQKDSVIIEWDAVENAQYYIIYKAIENPESFKVIESKVLKSSYIDPVPTDVHFYYRVAAGNGNKWSDPSPEVMGFALGEVLSPPASFSTRSEIKKIILEWDAALMAVSYNIHRCDVKYGTYTKINTDPVTDLSFTDDADIVPDKIYYYKITSVNAAGRPGPYSDIISGEAKQEVPGVPTNVTASDGTYGEKVMLTWTASEYAAYYEIYRADAELGEYVLIADEVTDIEYADRSLSDGDPKFYKVKAVSSGGPSDFSDAVQGSIDPDKPAQLPPPSGVRASKGKTNLITVSWDAVEGASGYTVYRSTSSGGTYTAIAGGRDPVTSEPDPINPPVVEGRVSYDNEETVTVKTTYFYKISTWSQSPTSGDWQESERSFTGAEGYTIPQIPDVPTGLTMTMNHTSGSLKLEWDAAARATSYNIYRSDGDPDTFNIVSMGQTGLVFEETTADSIEAGVEYYYKIEAVNDGGSVQTDYKGGIILGIPGNLAFTSVRAGWNYNITVTWSAVPGATGYILERSVGSEGWSSETIDGGTTTQKSYTGQPPARTYRFRIRAVNTNIGTEGVVSNTVQRYLY